MDVVVVFVVLVVVVFSVCFTCFFAVVVAFCRCDYFVFLVAAAVLILHCPFLDVCFLSLLGWGTAVVT